MISKIRKLSQIKIDDSRENLLLPLSMVKGGSFSAYVIRDLGIPMNLKSDLRMR